jgi:hypothetical protein
MNIVARKIGDRHVKARQDERITEVNNGESYYV